MSYKELKDAYDQVTKIIDGATNEDILRVLYQTPNSLISMSDERMGKVLIDLHLQSLPIT